MGLFSRRQSSALPPFTISALAEYGEAVLSSRSGRPLEPRFGWDYVGPVILAMHGPAREQVIQELYDAARAAPGQPLVTVGAYSLLNESGDEIRDERFQQLRDAFLDYMHQNRYSSGHLTGYEAERWIELHGDLRSTFDHIVDVEVPGPSEASATADLSPGEKLLVALTAPLPAGNAFYAERQADGSYIVFSERPRSSDDPTRVRCDESDELGTFASMSDLLRAVGRWFGVRPYWANEDLDPYFPSQRT